MAERATRPKQWLDLLPDEVCEAIAAHVTYGERSWCGTNLARTSKRQCHAVWSTVPHPVLVKFMRPDIFFVDEDDNELDIAEWALAFTDYEIHLSFVELTPQVAKVLRKAKVTKCSIWTRNDTFLFSSEPPLPWKTTKILDEVIAKDTIRYLSIELTKDANIKELFGQMATMNLEELHLRGSLKTGDWLYELTDACGDISTRCPSLRVIAMSELFIGRPDGRGMNQYHTDTYWRAVEKLPACCVIAAHSAPPDRLVGKLRKLRAVETCYLSPEEAGKLGPVVTKYIDCNKSWFTAERLDPLKRCRNVKELDLTLAPGAISYLQEILRHCTSVGTLHITAHEEKAPPGALLDLLRQAPHLHDLGVTDVMFSPPEWKAALEMLGGQLRRLVVWLELDDEDESFDEQVDRLEAILRCIPKCNRGLKKFVYRNIDCPTDLREHGTERYDLIMALVSKVQDAIPCLNSGELEEKYDNIIFIRNAEE